MPRVGFEPTTPVFERTQTVHVLERAATLIGNGTVYTTIILKKDKRIPLYQHLFISRGWQRYMFRPFHRSSSGVQEYWC
jgi:hypothetical protein